MDKLAEKIKLPSNWTIVNPDSIWKFLVAIAKTGSVFNKEQLIKSDLYTNNEDNISRNLAYLKYLGIVDEERGKGKDQKFRVIDQSSVKDILYEIKANRIEDAKKKLKEHLERHILFVTLKQDFFKSENEKTLNDLEHFLKDGMPGKGPSYYQKGGEFVIKLLSLVSLASLNGKDITLNENKSLNSIPNPEVKIDDIDETDIEVLDKKDSGKEVSKINNSSIQDAQIILSDKYIVHFIGPGMNSKLEIQEIDDLLIVEATLSKIKKKLAKNEAD